MAGVTCRLACFSVFLVLVACGGGAGTERRMNVLFIMADDLGLHDTSLYGSTFYETPNIDALGARGKRFTRAYAASPLCSPTRASIMTGLHPARVGITYPLCHLETVRLEKAVRAEAPPDKKWLKAETLTRLHPRYFTLAEAMRRGGYATGHFGKWHLGREPYDPLHHGFDVDVPRWYGYGPPKHYLAPWHVDPAMNIGPGAPGEHIEDVVTDHAIAFIKENKDRPFFVNYWAFGVHSPHETTPELEAKYQAKADPDAPQRHPVNAGMIENLDANIGRLVQTIDELGLADRTIIVFYSDNGGIHWPNRQHYPEAPVTSNAPLRGGKATIYEGGVREPCVVVWPGVTEPGSTTDAMITSTDWYPTLLEMVGLKPRLFQQFDGESFTPALRGEPFERDTVYVHYPHDWLPIAGNQPSTSVRHGDWKLIRFYCDNPDQSDRYELYNLAEDIGETHDLSAQRPKKVRELRLLMDRFLDETDAVIPKPNPAYQQPE